ncbi:MAG TPA: PorV/PorQ family protein [Elusimicrobiota bacterium]|nr:PorV/PorQ family protein [Elusimicrobiota bacterium]
MRLLLVAEMYPTGTVSAGAGAGTTAADFLLTPPDSRSAALGNSGVADAESPFSLYNNPALLSDAKSPLTLAGGVAEWPLGLQAQHYAVSSVWGTPADGPWGLGIFLSQWQTAPIQATDIYGNANGRVRYTARNVGLGLAHALSPALHLGGAVKTISQRFEETGRAGGNTGTGHSALAWDFGVAYDTPLKYVRVAAALQNTGNDVAFRQDQEKLPRALRLGMQGAFFNRQFQWAAEGRKLSGGALAVKGGMGFRPFPNMILRMGFDSGLRDIFLGVTTGVGFRLRNVDIDYAFVPLGNLGTTQRMTLAWRIGKTAPRTRNAERPPSLWSAN